MESCPRCQPKSTLALGRCGQCDGRFVIGDAYATLLAHIKADPADLPKTAAAHHEQSVIACVACGEKMQTIEFRGERIDYCPACPALWLDARESEALRGEHVLSGARERAEHKWALLRDKRLNMVAAIRYVPPPNNPSAFRVPQVVAPAAVGVVSAVVCAVFLGAGGLMVGLMGGGLAGLIIGNVMSGRPLHLSPPPPRPPTPDAPTVAATDDGFSLRYREQETVHVAVEAGDALTLWTEPTTHGARTELWLAVGERPAVLVVSLERPADAKALMACLEDWAHGMLGVTVHLRRSSAVSLAR